MNSTTEQFLKLTRENLEKLEEEYTEGLRKLRMSHGGFEEGRALTKIGAAIDIFKQTLQED